MTGNPIFHRQALLLGPDALLRLKKSRVILFGMGGVGSWCAESLVRSGVGALTIVDSDIVCVTNINRQLPATMDTVGQAKTDIMAERLKRINPECEITALQEVFHYTTAERFKLDQYNYVLDAIDTLSPKVDLIGNALNTGSTLFSAMGASCKLDPARIQAGSFWKVQGCPLAKKVRQRLRKRNIRADFQCVFSDEVRVPFEVPLGCGTEDCVYPKSAKDNPDAAVHERYRAKRQINGSAVHITAAFGFFLSWLVLRDVLDKSGGFPQERGKG